MISKGNVIIAFLATFAVLMLVSALLGERGFLSFLKLHDERRAQEEEIARIQRENGALKSRIQRVKRDEQALEALVRQELGWIRDGEIVYKFRSPTTPKEGAP
jgi:cell division protein FtsB